ncbi:hypothetical protein [Deinococcus fonticola]|uniref:hypothetical protein n=1 Tax=Deinococcus fonticola TaxID=2528713 RepID=UPI00107504F5|nr:hypothetical protein [Deinococcus fonticola]
MSTRVDSLMQAAGLQEPVLNTLERGEAVFVLTDQTLLYQDVGGTRRVTLRDLKRIHSDQEGLLRVETPAGTALTANLVGFDPAGVQSFFAQVRDATARAKQQTHTSTSTAPGPVIPAANPEPVAPKFLTPASAAPAQMPPAPAAQARPAAPPSGGFPAGTAAKWTGQEAVTPPSAPGVAPAAAPTPVPPPSSRTVVTPTFPDARADSGAAFPIAGATAPLAGGGLGLSSTQPSSMQPSSMQPSSTQPSPLTSPGFRPQESQPTPKPTVRAVRTPTVITDPGVSADPAPLSAQPGQESSLASSPMTNGPVANNPVAESPAMDTAPLPTRSNGTRTNGSAVSTLASLAAVAGGVARWMGALKAMSLIMLLATFAMAYFQYDKGQGLNGFWSLIAGGMGAVALWVLSDLVKLLVTLAQAVSAEGGVMDVD